jgi:hypothetical protein
VPTRVTRLWLASGTLWLLLWITLGLTGCTHADQPPLVPPPPDDLSTWAKNAQAAPLLAAGGNEGRGQGVRCPLSPAD